MFRRFLQQCFASPKRTAAPAQPAPTWNHPSLGTFTLNSYWTIPLKFPAFEAFSYTPRRSKAPPTDTYLVALDACNTDRQAPRPEMVALVENLFTHQAHLVVQIAHSLWDDFNGRGPDYGIWWRDALSTVRQCALEDHRNAPESPLDIPSLLRLHDILVHQYPRWDRPWITLTFDAAFEHEHGLGILTDGQHVAGIGFAGEAEPI